MKTPWSPGEKEVKLLTDLLGDEKGSGKILEVGSYQNILGIFAEGCPGKGQLFTLGTIYKFRSINFSGKYDKVILSHLLNFLPQESYIGLLEKAVGLLNLKGKVFARVLVKKENKETPTLFEGLKSFNFSLSGIILADLLCLSSSRETVYLASHDTARLFLQNMLQNFDFAQEVRRDIELFSTFFLFKKKNTISFIDESMLSALLDQLRVCSTKHLIYESYNFKLLVVELAFKETDEGVD